jgi:hypothetical protein
MCELSKAREKYPKGQMLGVQYTREHDSVFCCPPLHGPCRETRLPGERFTTGKYTDVQPWASADEWLIKKWGPPTLI